MLQAEAVSRLQEERSRLSAIVEQGLAEQAELDALRQQAGELSGVTHELQQTRQTLLELQAVARQLEQHRLQIATLADQKAELEGALQTQAALQAEVSVLHHQYEDLVAKAERAKALGEDLPALQVREAGLGVLGWRWDCRGRVRCGRRGLLRAQQPSGVVGTLLSLSWLPALSGIGHNVAQPGRLQGGGWLQTNLACC